MYKDSNAGLSNLSVQAPLRIFPSRERKKSRKKYKEGSQSGALVKHIFTKNGIFHKSNLSGEISLC